MYINEIEWDTVINQEMRIKIFILLFKPFSKKTKVMIKKKNCENIPLLLFVQWVVLFL